MGSLVTTFIVLMASQFYYVDKLGGSSTETVSGTHITVLTIFLVLLLVSVVGIMVLVAVREVLKSVRKKLPFWLRNRLGLNDRLELDRNFVPDEDWSDSSDYLIAMPVTGRAAKETDREDYRRVVDDAFYEYATKESKRAHSAYKESRAFERKREAALEQLYRVALEKQLSPERVEEMEAMMLAGMGNTLSGEEDSDDEGRVGGGDPFESSHALLGLKVSKRRKDGESSDDVSELASRNVRPAELLVDRKGLLKVLRYVDVNADLPRYARLNQKPLFRFVDAHGYVPKSLFFALYLKEPSGWRDQVSSTISAITGGTTTEYEYETDVGGTSGGGGVTSGLDDDDDSYYDDVDGGGGDDSGGRYFS